MSQKQKQSGTPDRKDSPKGGSALFSKGTKSVAAEDMFEHKKRDKDGKPVAEKKK